MGKKSTRSFKVLQRKHQDAVAARKQAARARKAILGFGGLMGEITALASGIGTQAVKAELEALRAERRALKKLHVVAAAMVEGRDVASETQELASDAAETEDA
jgi:hypothetical protein